MADSTTTKKPPRIPVATPNIGTSPGPGAGAGPVAAGGGPSSNVISVPLETALSAAIGARIRITTTLSQTIEGTIFTADPLLNQLAINTSSTAATRDLPADYHIISISRIQKMDLLSLSSPQSKNGGGGGGATRGAGSFGDALPKLGRIDPSMLEQRLQKAMAAERKREERRGKGVTTEGQGIFDAISRTLPTRWHNQSINVLDSVMIEPPYFADNCKAPEKHAKELARVKKVLDYERKKILDREKASSTMTPATATSTVNSTPSNSTATTAAAAATATASNNLGEGTRGIVEVRKGG